MVSVVMSGWGRLAGKRGVETGRFRTPSVMFGKLSDVAGTVTAESAPVRINGRNRAACRSFDIAANLGHCSLEITIARE